MRPSLFKAASTNPDQIQIESRLPIAIYAAPATLIIPGLALATTTSEYIRRVTQFRSKSIQTLSGSCLPIDLASLTLGEYSLLHNPFCFSASVQETKFVLFGVSIYRAFSGTTL
jgi:hypothetical protein